ncbi:hypothetical protein EJ05DRAFT_230706 [Pseudovirgaria hyperparasitica]|uniref:Rhodopsin domain-containing protein n=1 Tax=Pseudovirgaria hyperparasitica TaxID=470096 RepID=A0A6A6VTV9_9PEZI|nr:uncharacterized protein EJ05DRAFT_230706 [Pseudovirgaria hyperparasitica]KAF2753040.1 hypothetical protein EJ05DRAFT_230706 [Pseudovirgaria hyperparasitica]
MPVDVYRRRDGKSPCTGAIKLSELFFFFRRVFPISHISQDHRCIHCLDSVVGSRVHVSRNLPVCDVAILVLPFPIMRRLHRRPRERWGIAGIFALGWISAAAGAVRLYYVVHATKIDQDALRAENPIPVYMPPSTWTFTELCVGITAANLPPLAPLIRKAPSAAAKAKMSISSSWLSIRSTRNGSTTVPVSVKEVVDETHVHTLDQYRITQCRRPIDGHDSQIGPLQVPESLVLAGSDTGEVYRASSPRRYHSEMVRVRLSLG